MPCHMWDICTVALLCVYVRESLNLNVAGMPIHMQNTCKMARRLRVWVHVLLGVTYHRMPCHTQDICEVACVWVHVLLIATYSETPCHTWDNCKMARLCVRVHVLLGVTYHEMPCHTWDNCKMARLCVWVHVLLSAAYRETPCHTWDICAVSHQCLYVYDETLTVAVRFHFSFLLSRHPGGEHLHRIHYLQNRLYGRPRYRADRVRHNSVLRRHWPVAQQRHLVTNCHTQVSLEKSSCRL